MTSPLPPDPRPLRGVPLFLFLWLMAGFSLGTSTLLGPLRWVTGLGRRAGWAEPVENAAVVVIIALLVCVSAGVALALTGITRRTGRREVRLGVPALAALAMLGAVWLWMDPARLQADMGEESPAGTRFTFGPYPDEAALARLKREGHTAVVPLLHPAVVPFEPVLLAEEIAAAARVGIEVIHLPMLPWISDNHEALERVRDLARGETGRYYVHCYLGKDRVQVVRRLVEKTAPGAAGVQASGGARRLSGKQAFERGDVYRLDERVYLTPYPTDEEFLMYILTGGVSRVVSLLDPDNPEDREWIEKERRLFEAHDLPFTNLPIPIDRHDPFAVLEAARRVRGLSGTVVVHAFLSPSTGRSPGAEAFLQAWRSGRPPLPPAHFRAPLKGGPAEVLAPHIAAGPRPAVGEFNSYLALRGVRAALHVGRPEPEAARQDSAAARGARLEWRSAAPDDPEALLDRLDRGGPYYLYGPGLESVRAAIAGRFGPAVPERSAADPRRPAEEAAAGFALSGPPAATREFIARAVPGLDMVILAGPILLLVTALAAGLAGWLRVDRGVPAPFTRKVFHFTIFTLAGLLHLAAGLPIVMLFGGLVSLAVLYAVVRGDRFPFYEALARPTDHPRRTLFILVPLATTAIGGVLANLMFGGFAIVGYLVGGWGDAVGEPVGAAWGRHRYRVPSLGGVPAQRSLEGSAAVLLAGIVAAMAALVAQGVSPMAALWAGALCGAAGAAVEAISTHGIDNLTVQVAAAGTAYALLA